MTKLIKDISTTQKKINDKFIEKALGAKKIGSVKLTRPGVKLTQPGVKLT